MENDTPGRQPAEDREGRIVASRPTRRRFLKAGLVGLLPPLLGGCVAGGFTQAVFAFLSPKKHIPIGSKIALPGTIADYPLNSVTMVREGKFYLSHVPEGLLALYWKCKHLGCTVPWKPDEEFAGSSPAGVFHCPCHESIYLRNGVNVAGPAPEPLDYMDITIVGDKITVDTTKINKRLRFDPSQATKV